MAQELQRRLREIFDKRRREQEEEEMAQPPSEAAGVASSEVNLAAESLTLAPTQGESESEQEREQREDQPDEDAQAGPTGVAACRVASWEDTGMWEFSTEPRATNIHLHRLFHHCPLPTCCSHMAFPLPTPSPTRGSPPMPIAVR
jgi:hypothetical protein